MIITANQSFFKNSFSIHHHRMEQIRFEYLLFSLSTFQKRILEFIKPRPNSIFNVPNSSSLTYLTRLRVGLSHLREHIFRHNFGDSLNPTCNYRNATTESTKHYLLHCWNFQNEKQSLLQNVLTVNPNLLSMNADVLTHLLLYGNNTLTGNTNTFPLNSVRKAIHTNSTTRNVKMTFICWPTHLHTHRNVKIIPHNFL